MASTLPKVKEIQKRSENKRYYKLRANTYIIELNLKNLLEQYNNRQSFTAAMLSQEMLDMKVSLLKSVVEEKENIRRDSEALDRVDAKVIKFKKARMQNLSKYKKLSERDTKTFDASLAEFEALTALRKAQRPLVLPKIKLNYELIYPNVKKPAAYTQLRLASIPRDMKPLNDSNVHKLLTILERKMFSLSVLNSMDSEMDRKRSKEATPFITQLASKFNGYAGDSAQRRVDRIVKQIAETRLLVKNFDAKKSEQVERILQSCIVTSVKLQRSIAGGSEGAFITELDDDDDDDQSPPCSSTNDVNPPSINDRDHSDKLLSDVEDFQAKRSLTML